MNPTRPMYWSVRRELWENRSIYIAPLAVAGVFLFGFLISTITLPGRLRAASGAAQLRLLEQPYNFAAILIMAATFIVAVFYCLDALHGERRDRSILFWKSLPVSDLTTVLSKACVPIVILPLLTFALTVVTQGILLLLTSAVLAGSGLSVAAHWTQVSFLQKSLVLLYHLVTVHALWHAPIFGWLLLVSAWARRAALLWAVIPPLAIGVFEKMVFNTTHFAALMGSRIAGGAAAVTGHGTGPMDPPAHITPFLSAPGLWVGLAVTAAFLAGAVRIRHYREPI